MQAKLEIGDVVIASTVIDVYDEDRVDPCDKQHMLRVVFTNQNTYAFLWNSIDISDRNMGNVKGEDIVVALGPEVDPVLQEYFDALTDLEIERRAGLPYMK
jgi:hypothetical protein